MIVHGNQQGPYFGPNGWNTICEMAQLMIDELPIQGDLTVWYDQRHDFYNIRATIDGTEYIVRKYKVWGLTKEPKAKPDSVTGFDSPYWDKTFGHNEHGVIRYLKKKDAKWEIKTRFSRV